ARVAQQLPGGAAAATRVVDRPGEAGRPAGAGGVRRGDGDVGGAGGGRRAGDQAAGADRQPGPQARGRGAERLPGRRVARRDLQADGRAGVGGLAAWVVDGHGVAATAAAGGEGGGPVRGAPAGNRGVAGADREQAARLVGPRVLRRGGACGRGAGEGVD